MISAVKVKAIQSDWVGRVIDGRFTLLQWLGGSNRSSVFLIELPGEPPQKAIIKLMAADARVEDRLAFAANASRAHSQLVRVLQTGSLEIDGTAFAFVVTEFADEVLSEILPVRALAPEEVKEMLVPVLDALSDLHRHGLVHGRLKPSNILVVNDELKLSSDGVQLVGATADDRVPGTIYDAPELTGGTLSPASDVWSLGVTTVEALTQRTPEWIRSSNPEVQIPESIPQPFAAILAATLRVNPAHRATLKDIRERLGLASPVAEVKPVAETRPEAAARSAPATMPVSPTPQPTPVPKAEPRPPVQPQQRPAAQPQQKRSARSQRRAAAKAHQKATVQSPQKLPSQDQAKAQPQPQPKAQRQAQAEPQPQAHTQYQPAVMYGLAPDPRDLQAEPRRSSRALSRFAGEDDRKPRRKLRGGGLLILVLILIAVAAILWFRSPGTLPATKSNDEPRAHSSTPAPAAPEEQLKAPIEPEQQMPPPGSTPSAMSSAALGQPSGGAAKGAVAQRVMPDVARSASRTIRGTLNVSVRVDVSPGGEVQNASFDSAGPSKYFARVAMEAARRWKFTPAQANGQPVPSVWTLHFAFTRENTHVTPVQTSP